MKWLRQFLLQSIDLFADGETTCEHIVYIRDTKNSANIYIKAQNPYSTIAIRGGSYTGVFEGVINGLINDKTIIPFTNYINKRCKSGTSSCN